MNGILSSSGSCDVSMLWTVPEITCNFDNTRNAFAWLSEFLVFWFCFSFNDECKKSPRNEHAACYFDSAVTGRKASCGTLKWNYLTSDKNVWHEPCAAQFNLLSFTSKCWEGRGKTGEWICATIVKMKVIFSSASASSSEIPEIHLYPNKWWDDEKRCVTDLNLRCFLLLLFITFLCLINSVINFSRWQTGRSIRRRQQQRSALNLACWNRILKVFAEATTVDEDEM